MRARGEGLRRRADSLLFRIRGLASLRQLVNLSSEQDITARQWSVLEMQLNAASALLTTRTKAATDSLLPRARDASARPIRPWTPAWSGRWTRPSIRTSR